MTAALAVANVARDKRWKERRTNEELPLQSV